jgi:hypothetical protein
VSTEIEHDNFIKALFEKNRDLFGDIRMEVDPDEEKPAEGEAEEKSETPPAEGEGEADEDKDDKKDDVDSLPEWAKKELTRARGEAANYRTQLREAERKLGEAKTPEEVEAAISELREQNAKLERAIIVSKVATKYGLSDFLASRLIGSTEAELEADAKLAAKEVPVATPPPPSVSGGLDPSDSEDSEIDPRKLAARFRRI